MCTKYTCVENSVGIPATSTTSRAKKRNPARERRSKLRLDEFMRKKKEASQEQQSGGEGLENQSKVAVGESRQLILELPMGQGGRKAVETRQDISPIPQFHGADIVKKVAYTFRSEYGEEDIAYSLSKIFPENVTTTMISRLRLGMQSADHLCTLELEPVDAHNFSWPVMNASDSEVIRELERI